MRSAFHADEDWKRSLVQSNDVTEASNRAPKKGRILLGVRNGMASWEFAVR